MSGFFKKLFNRIAGKKEEAPPPDLPPEVAAEPTPEPASVAEVVPAALPEPEPIRERVSAAAPEPIADVQPEPEAIPEPEPAPESEAVAEAAPEPVLVAAPAPEAISAPEPAAPRVAKGKPAKVPSPKIPLAKASPARPAPGKSRVKANAAEPTAVDTEIAEVREPEPAAAEPTARGEDTRPALSAEPIAPVPPAPAPAIEIVAPPLPEPELAPEPIAVPPPALVETPLPPAPSTVEVVMLAPVASRKGWMSRLREGLSKSSRSITGSITSIFTKRRLDAGTLQDLEDVLLQADLGLPMAERIVKAVAAGRYDKEVDPDDVKRILAAEVEKVLAPVEVPFNFGAEKPFVILVVGVNGAGKTTTIGKLGAIAAREGFQVMFAACDTFRAAAIEQLTVWGQRIGATVMSRPTGADASGLAFDAMKEARAAGTDILFIDTAGRLQNKAYLMDELDKIVRVIRKQDETAPHAVLLVLDATTGQNAMAQADIFTKVAGVTGIIMTKLDGTARGGILVAIAERFKLPVHAIGVGEQIDDLQPFDAESFARAIAGLEDQ